MRKNAIPKGVTLFCILLILPLINANPVEAVTGWDEGTYGSSSVIHVSDVGSPVNNTELNYVQWATDEIMEWCFEPRVYYVIYYGQVYWMGPAFSYLKNYMDNYESSTSYSNVISDINRGENHDSYFPFATFLYIGHNAYQAGVVNHYGFLGHGKGLPSNSPSINKLWDYNIYSTVSNFYNHFVFLWVCRNGNEKGSYHSYPYAPNGMRYCWTHGRINSVNGYDYPDYTTYCLISFEGMSPMLCEYLDPTVTNLRHKHWLVYFYYALFEGNLSIKQALIQASIWCGYTGGFTQTKLYNGGLQYYPGEPSIGYPPKWEWSKMRMYGDASFNVPGDLAYVYP
jgi:hypothetical protein